MTIAMHCALGIDDAVAETRRAAWAGPGDDDDDDDDETPIGDPPDDDGGDYDDEDDDEDEEPLQALTDGTTPEA
jgi:hypothetical protein